MDLDKIKRNILIRIKEKIWVITTNIHIKIIDSIKQIKIKNTFSVSY